MQSHLIALLLVPFLLGSMPIYGQNDSKELSIAVVPKGTDKERWKAIHAGALKASEELYAEGVNVRILWKGDNAAARDKQIQVVDTFTGQLNR